jgi:tetratricopeptide (TPR) repeat protein
MSDEELVRRYRLLRTDPQQFLALAHEDVRQDPTDSGAYFTRHQAWTQLGRRDLALQDLNTAIALKPQSVSFECRGEVLRDLGRYEEAIADFNRSEAIDPKAWDNAFNPVLRADCHARLGNETAAMADIARLREDYWTPGVLGFPAGGKAVVTEEIRRRAIASRERKASQVG